MDNLGVKELLRYILRTVYIIYANVSCIPAYITWQFLLYPVRKFAPEQYWKIEGWLFVALIKIVVGWIESGGYTLIESGDVLESIYNENAILLVNHQSTSDVPIVMAGLHSKGLVCRQVMWIMDYIFKFTNFGWVSCFHGDFFILQGKQFRETQLQKLGEHLKNIYKTTYKKWIVLFPEGGFLRKRRHMSKVFAKKNDLPVLDHVTLPRVGALKVIMDSLAPSSNGTPKNKPDDQKLQTNIKWIIDMTIGYPNAEALDLHGMCIGYWSSRNIYVHFRAYPISQVPLDTEELTKWMYERYQEKEQILNNFYKNNKSLNDSDVQERSLPRITNRKIELNWIAVIGYHLFYLACSYVFWNYFYCYIFSFIGFILSFVI